MYSIDKSPESQQEFRQALQAPVLRELLTDAEIETACAKLGPACPSRFVTR